MKAMVIEVRFRYVALEADDRSTIVPAGAEAIARKKIGSSLPVDLDASPALRRAAFEPRMEIDDAAVKTILDEARADA